MSNYLKKYQFKKLKDYSLSNNIDNEYEKIFNIDNKKLTLIINKYPDPEYRNLIGSIKKEYKINNLVLGNGSEDLIIRINFLLKKMGTIGIVVPNFYRIIETSGEYFEINPSEGIDSIYSNIDSLLINNNIKSIWISNPNPLTGKLYKRKELLYLIEKYNKILFIIDESAIDFLENVEDSSLINHSQKQKNLLVIRSFSKLYGMAGIRAAFITGKAKVIENIKEIGPTFPISGLGEYLIMATFKNKNRINKIKRKIKKNKITIENALIKNNNIVMNKSSTNCIFIKHKTENIFKKLLKSKILTLNLNTQKGISKKNFVRITIHSSDKLFNDLYVSLKKNKIIN